MIEEIRGISSGAGMEFEEVFAVNCLTELSMNVKDFGPTFFGCTAFAAQGSATEENKIFIGQNQDLWAPWCRDLFTVLKINPSSGPRILTTTLAGMVGMVGMNSEGLAIVGNGLSATGNQLGVPIMLFTRQTLSKRTIGEVIDLYTKSKRASPLNVMVGNSDGEIYDFELAPKDLDYFYTGDGVFAHTNNFLSEKMKGQETVKESIFYPDTIVRVNRMSKLLHDKEGHIKLEDVQGFLSDHVNRPRSICRHPDPTIPQDRWEDQWETTASVVMELKGSKMWIAPGNPCMNEYHQYRLTDRQTDRQRNERLLSRFLCPATTRSDKVPGYPIQPPSLGFGLELDRKLNHRYGRADRSLAIGTPLPIIEPTAIRGVGAPPSRSSSFDKPHRRCHRLRVDRSILSIYLATCRQHLPVRVLPGGRTDGRTDGRPNHLVDLIRGSSRSLSPSPSRLKPITTMKIMIAGKIGYHHACCIKS